MDTIKEQSDDPGLYNSRSIKVYISYIKQQYPYINIHDLLIQSGIEPNQVEDSDMWFTQKQFNQFADNMIKKTGNKKIGNKAGTFFAEALNNEREYLLRFLSPKNVFKNINSIAKRVTRGCDFYGTVISENRVEIRVVPNKNVTEIPMQCDNRRGYFEGILKLFNVDHFKINHPECKFAHNATQCKYVIQWEGSPYNKKRKFIRILPYTLLLLIMVLCTQDGMVNPLAVLSLLTMIAFICFDRINYNAIQFIEKKSSNAYDKLMEEIEINYSQSQVVLTVAEILSNDENVLQQILEILTHNLGYQRGIIMLIRDETPRKLYFETGFGYTEAEIQDWKNQDGFIVDRDDSQGVFIVAFKEKRSIWIPNMERYQSYLSDRSKKLVDKLKVKALICCPIIYQNDVLGIIAIDRKQDNAPFRDSDLNILMCLARMAGIAIYNSK